jgi:hypothetical protein
MFGGDGISPREDSVNWPTYELPGNIEEGTDVVEGPAKAEGVSKPGWGCCWGIVVTCMDCAGPGDIMIEPAKGVRYRWDDIED